LRNSLRTQSISSVPKESGALCVASRRGHQSHARHMATLCPDSPFKIYGLVRIY
jgi:hypothetical protein